MANPRDKLGVCDDRGRLGGVLPEGAGEAGRDFLRCDICGALKFGRLHSNRRNPIGVSVAESNALPESLGCCGVDGGVHTNHPFRNRPPPPEALRRILEPERAQRGEEFDPAGFLLWKERSRAINSVLSFASSTVAEANIGGGGNAPPHFALNGSVHHNVGPIQANPGRTPAFAQMYFHDDSEFDITALRVQTGHLGETPASRAMVENLESMIRDYHPFHAVMRPAVAEWRATAEQDRVAAELVFLHDDGNVTQAFQGARDNNSGDAVAGVRPALHFSSPREVTVIYSSSRSTHSNGLLRLRSTSACVDSLAYPVFFPHGTAGWHANIPHDINRAERLRAARATGLRDHNSDNVTALQYYKYAIQIRDNPRGVLQHDVLHRGYRLFEQYLIDSFVKIEDKNLDFIRNNQANIRADVYQGLQDAVQNDEQRNAGVRIVLPSSVMYSPRDMAQRFQDAIAIARSQERMSPHLFITMTCNPNWEEIRAALLTRQTAKDRPDIVARVFQMKKEELIKDIMEKNVFGRAVAYVQVIEFQKRGLPHMHLVVWLAESPSIEDCDQMVCAELPPKGAPGSEQRRLYDIVTRNMTHDCTPQRCDPNAHGNGYCKDHYPKPFTDQTYIDDEHGIMMYRRRDPAAMLPEEWPQMPQDQQEEMRMKQSRVVPYNAFLLLKYNCHINVEISTSAQAIKYLFKYMHKGSDHCAYFVRRIIRDNRTDPQELDDNDEIQRYQNARWIGSVEAAWRLFEFPLFKKSHTIIRLQVHLPNEQTVRWNGNDSGAAEAVLERGRNTPLTRFFETVRDERQQREREELEVQQRRERGDIEDAEEVAENTTRRAYNLTYVQFPLHYTWNSRNQTWSRRRANRNIAARMFNVRPSQGERFFLRCLLTVVQGPESFEDLRTHGGVVHATYRDACIARGIFADDQEWHHCMDEATTFATPSQLRELFVNILLNAEDELLNPRALWDSYVVEMSEDFAYSDHRRQVPNDLDFNACALTISEIMQRNGRNSQDFDIPAHDPQRPHPTHTPPDFFQQYMPQLGESNLLHEIINVGLQLANEQQRSFYHEVMNDVNNERGTLYNLQAPGGHGKTFVLQLILWAIRESSEIAIATAATGIASQLYECATTLHSIAGIPVPTTSTSVSRISGNSSNRMAILWKRAKLLVVDEAVGLDLDVIDCLDRMLRDVRGNNRPFGGMTVILSGDARQTLPIVQHGNRATQVSRLLCNLPIWQDVEQRGLIQNERVRQRMLESGQSNAEAAQSHAEFLLRVGNGTVENVTGTIEGQPMRYTDLIEVPQHIVMDSHNMDDMLQYVYSELPELRGQERQNYLASRAILTPKNATALELNNRVLDTYMPDEEIHCFRSQDSLRPNDDEGTNTSSARTTGNASGTQMQFPLEYLNTINSASIPLHELRLKPGAVVMLMCNMNRGAGLCNGTRLIYERAQGHLLVCRIAHGPHQGRIALIPRVNLTPSDVRHPFTLVRRQYPIKLAFAMTIHKSQGQSLRTVGIYLPDPVFAHGLLYVALSRVGDAADVRVLVVNNPPNHGHMRRNDTINAAESVVTRNVVYREVFNYMRIQPDLQLQCIAPMDQAMRHNVLQLQSEYQTLLTSRQHLLAPATEPRVAGASSQINEVAMANRLSRQRAREQDNQDAESRRLHVAEAELQRQRDRAERRQRWIDAREEAALSRAEEITQRRVDRMVGQRESAQRRPTRDDEHMVRQSQQAHDAQQNEHIVRQSMASANAICGICTEQITGRAGAVLNPHCNHTYHSACIAQWIGSTSFTCPQCRSPLTSVDGISSRLEDANPNEGDVDLDSCERAAAEILAFAHQRNGVVQNQEALHSDGNEDQCMVCLETIAHDATGPRSNAVLSPSCVHHYHTECIQNWMAHAHRQGIAQSCPQCRQVIIAVNGVALDNQQSAVERAEVANLQAARELDVELNAQQYEDATGDSWGGSRFRPTASWLYVSLIRAALSMDPGHTYDAQRFLPTNLWNEIVRRYTLDFATRGLTAQTELHRFNASGYMVDDDQEELLQAANEPGRGNSLILEPHPLHRTIEYIVGIARNRNLPTADDVIAATQAHIEHGNLQHHFLWP